MISYLYQNDQERLLCKHDNWIQSALIEQIESLRGREPPHAEQCYIDLLITTTLSLRVVELRPHIWVGWADYGSRLDTVIEEK